MFFRMLKKDLKRKKAMNIVLLVFILLSAMFASGSMNNMISVYGGIDHFFDKAGMSDFIMIMRYENGENKADEVMNSASSVKDFKKEEVIYYSSANLLKDGEKYTNFENPGLIVSVSGAKLNYYNRKDEPIEEVPKGHVYIGGCLADPGKTKIGDTVNIEFEGISLPVVIDGYLKDALMGSQFLGNPRMLMNDEDMEILLQNENVVANSTGAVYYVYTDDLKGVKADLTKVGNVMFAKEKAVIKMAYMIDMLVAGLMLVVSICLILIAFTMLAFTIRFTLEEDFREIGVMKAVGLKDRSIRMMYMVKYLGISVAGAAIGYVCSVPFGDLMLQSVTERIFVGNDNRAFVGILSALAVVFVTLAFCYSCTKRIRKMSPIDAVHSGETGERYHKRSALRLCGSKLGCDLFLAANDVLSKPRQYVSMTVTFTLCLLLITMLATASNTLTSEKLLFLFGTTESDVYYSSSEKIMALMGSTDEHEQEKQFEEIEKILADNGMPGKVHQELLYQLPVTFKDTKIQVQMQQCTDTKTTDYVYSEGVAPIYPNEVAFTPQILDSLGAKIGDKVKILVEGEEKEFLVTATFVSFNQMGEAGRFHEGLELIPNHASAAFSFQIDFDDDPDKAETEKRIERLKEIFGTEKIYDVSGFVDTSTNSSRAIGTAKDLVLLIAVIIAGLITVLMERSFLSREASEIALMKAIGFKNSSVSAQHTLRFLVVAVISGLCALILNYPATKLVCDRIFGTMGAIKGISYDIRPVELFAVYPAILIAAVCLTSFLTSLYARTINTDSMGNIE